MSRTPVTFGVTNFFRSFRRRFPRSQTTRAQHTLILAALGELLSERLIENGDCPFFSRMGSFKIRCLKPKGNISRMIDFNETRLAGHNVYHFNDHSNGLLAKVIWDRDGNSCLFPDKFMWTFKAVRQMKRALAKSMKDGKQYPIHIQ